MKSILQNKKAQMDIPIIGFVVFFAILLLIGPIMLKTFNVIKVNYGNALGNSSIAGGNLSRENFDVVMSTGINFWDEIMIACFVLSIILLIVSSFLIDTHPVWIIIYVLACFFLILFAPTIISALGNVYDSAIFAQESSQLSFLGWIKDNFAIVLVGLMVLTGIIIFGKIALTRGGSR